MTLTKAYLIILASIVGVALGGVAFDFFGLESNVAMFTLLGAFIVTFLTGTAVWAGAKGHHPVLGVACGWFGPLGLLVLAGLPDRAKQVSRV